MLYQFVYHSSAPNIVGITQNIIVTLRQQMKTHSQHIGPVILNCISGSERSGLVALAIAAVLASNSKRPSLISKSFYLETLIRTQQIISFCS